MQTIIETPAYLSDAKALGLTDAERTAIVDYIAQCPSAGEVMSGTGGARKVRFGGRGKGKSGGYRVITFYSGDDIPVFLLNIFAKGEKVNLTKTEQNELRAILADVVAAYRGGVRRYVESREQNPDQRTPSPGVRHRRSRTLWVSESARKAASGMGSSTTIANPKPADSLDHPDAHALR